MYLIPNPQRWKEKEGTCYLPYTGQIVMNESLSLDTYDYVQLLSKYMTESTGFTYEIRRESGKGPIFLKIDGELHAEHYNLEIGESQITISAGDDHGILYGIQTLGQILQQKGAVLPCLSIEDFPAMPNRGYFFDTSRGRVPTLKWLKSLADILSRYKMNQLQLYVEHSFLFSGLSEVWRDDTPLTAGEIMELDEYCSRRGIELIPALASFGHLYKILSTKSFHHLCELPDANKYLFSFEDRMHHHTIDVSNAESFSFIKNLFLEYMPLFKSRKFNICADETFDLGKGKNKERAKREGIAELYMEYLGRLCSLIISEGHIPMFWGDIMLAFPEMLHALPEETVCLSWGYAKNETEDFTRTYGQVGAKQYVCPGVSGWNQLLNLQESSFWNISRMCEYGEKYGAIGMLNTDWGDYGHINHPDFSIPGLAYGAQASWNRDNIAYEEMNRKISLIEYRDTSEQLVSVIGELCIQESFGWQTAVLWKELHDSGSGEEEYRDFILGEEKKISLVGEKNAVIKQCRHKLYRCIATMDSGTKGRIMPYFIAAEGMEILNRLGEILLVSTCKDVTLTGEKEFKNKAWKLAEDLEIWYYQYRILWHTVSKESELYRISEVIYWYADYLREQGHV